MKKILLYFILLIAIGMAGTVAYVSVSGLIKVFAGAGTAGLIFFTVIEIAKIVATSSIHTYGKKIGWLFNILLSIFIFLSMAITSLGIYGFLSSSYKETFSKMENMDAQIELLEKRRDGYQTQLTQVNSEKTSVTNTITELSKGLSNNVIQYKDPETGQIITTTSSSTRRALEKQLDRTVDRQDVLNEKSDGLSDKVFEIENEITEVKIGDGTASELGPLKYLADVTGMTMDDVMKWFILLLIVIGDPMAVVMVIVYNKVVNYVDDVVEEPKTPLTSPVLLHDVVEDVVDVVVNPVTGEIDLSGEIPPMEEEYWIGSGGDSVEVEMSVPEGKEFNTQYPIEEPMEVIEEKEHVFPFPIVEPMIHKPKEKKPVEIIIPEPIIKVEDQIKENQEEIKKIQREDIKEIKKGTRGYSVNVPQPTNRIDRVGQNKYIKNDDGKVIYKRGS